MPFVIAFIGILALVVAIRGTYVQFGQLLASEFQGANNFEYWIVSLGVVGALGYIPPLKDLSRAFMALLILVLFLKQGDPTSGSGGFFSKFNAVLKSS